MTVRFVKPTLQINRLIIPKTSSLSVFICNFAAAMKEVLSMLCFLLVCSWATAQTDSLKTKQKKERQVELSGEVYDSFTKAQVKALMTLMRKDSTVVDTMTCWTWGTNSYYEFKVPAKNDDFIIRAQAEGYQDTCIVYQLRHIARNNYY
mgnify:CR=1 FL=1